MKALVLPAMLSFVMGAFGYILIRFWAVPIVKYRRLKGRIANSLRGLAAAEPASIQETAGHRQQVKRQAAQLTALYAGDLPQWYKLWLRNRGELPQQAATHLMTLANIRKFEHGRRRIAQIQEALKLKV